MSAKMTPEEEQFRQDLAEYEENFSLFIKLLKKRQFYSDLMIDKDDTISEPCNSPAFYSVVEVVQIAEICGLSALVTVESGNVVIKIS